MFEGFKGEGPSHEEPLFSAAETKELEAMATVPTSEIPQAEGVAMSEEMKINAEAAKLQAQIEKEHVLEQAEKAAAAAFDGEQKKAA